MGESRGGRVSLDEVQWERAPRKNLVHQQNTHPDTVRMVCGIAVEAMLILPFCLKLKWP